MLPCFPSFREFFVLASEENSASSNRDPLPVVSGNDENQSNGNRNGSSSHSDVENRKQKSHHLPGKTRRKQSASLVILKLDAFSGALQLPQYKLLSRDSCPLLRHCWSHRWEKVADLCALEPHRALHITEHSRRTALHLAIFNRRCPLDVAQSLLTANRHMILVQDANRYTPLHLLAFFSTAKPPVQEQGFTANQEEELTKMRHLFHQLVERVQSFWLPNATVHFRCSKRCSTLENEQGGLLRRQVENHIGTVKLWTSILVR
jgi:hypothetical protein